jgi:hypothetical protein
MDQSINEMIDIIDNDLQLAITNDNWKEAENQFFIMKKIWNQHQSMYNLFIDQASLTEINYSNAKLGVFLNYKNPVLALSELSYIKEHLLSLHKDELISIENIL